MKKPIVIAEVGCNHKGDLALAKEFIRSAKEFCNVAAVKFQKRTVKEVLSPEEYNSPHPNPANSYGATYGAHREFLEFNVDQHRELKAFCESIGIVYSCSVWDLTAAKDIASLDPEFIKIPSATNTHFEVLEWLCKNYKGKIHLSLGMTTRSEERQIVQFFESQKRIKDLVLYACTSGYPVPPEDVCLLEIRRLKEAYGSRVDSIGFSGHHNGISIDIAAFALGATQFERHFTMDRTWKGTDHAASLEPDGLRRLQRDLLHVQNALTFKQTELLPIELPQRKKLKWDRFLKKASPAGAETSAQGGKSPKVKAVVFALDGVLASNSTYLSKDGSEIRRYHRKDFEALQNLLSKGLKVAALYDGSSPPILEKLKKMKVEILSPGSSAEDRLQALKKFLQAHDCAPESAAFLGGESSDLPCLNYVGVPVAAGDAPFSCKVVAHQVCSVDSGNGCLDEFASGLCVS